MAASPTPRPTPAEPALEALRAFAERHALVPPVAVAYSGGADSTALLHAAVALWPGRVGALHVHHGLQAAADDFQFHCQSVCQALGVALTVLRVDARPQPGQSPEDAARQARYQALAQAAQGRPVLLGQHADDQAETVLLALGRGAGLAGLAAMPESFERRGARFLRPFLALPGTSLRSQLQTGGLAYIDDPTNADERYTRNRLRARLMPALAELWPQYRQTLARSARHAAQAQQLLEEIAEQDLALAGSPPRLHALRGLSPARQANALRHWLARHHGVRPSTAQLDELLRQVQACTTRGHRIELRVAHGRVQREGERLGFVALEPPA